MKSKKINKRALLPTTLATIIIIIISALILIFFLGQFSGLFGEQIDKETCHTSVVLRGQQSLIGEATKRAIPLRCKTAYKCLSMGGKCPEDYTKIEVRDEEDIKREIANAMYDCWWQLGEGKINFLKSEWMGKNTCLFCSLISFDNKIQEKYSEIKDLSNYIAKTNIPEKNITYLQYLSNNPNVEIPPSNVGDKYSTNEKYAITFGYTNEGVLAERITGGAGCIAGGGAGAAVGFTIGSAVPIIGNAVGAGLGFAIGATGCYFGITAGVGVTSFIENLFGKGYDYSVGVQLLQFTPENVKNFGCNEIESIP